MAKDFGFSPDTAKRIIAATRDNERAGPNTVGPSTSPLPQMRRHFFGILQSSGPDAEADYTDNRYWFQASYISSTDLPLEFAPIMGAGAIWDTATNLPEDGHHWPEGTPVTIYWEYDADGTGRYTMELPFCCDSPGSSSSSASSASSNAESSSSSSSSSIAGNSSSSSSSSGDCHTSIPPCPGTDGDYVLTVTVGDGKCCYKWTPTGPCPSESSGV